MRNFVVALTFSLLAHAVSAAMPTEKGHAAAHECWTLFHASDFAKLDARLDEWLTTNAEDDVSDPLAASCVGAFASVEEPDLSRLDTWATQDPKSYAASVIAGYAWMKRGQKLRGTDFYSKLTKQQVADLERCMSRALILLRHAESLRPGDGLAPSLQISALTFIGAPESEVVKAFERAVALHPEWIPPYEAMRGFNLLPQWSGDDHVALDFARAVRDAHPSNSRLFAIVANVHWDSRLRVKSGEYFKVPLNWQETRDGYLSYLEFHPTRYPVWARLLRPSWEAHDDPIFLEVMSHLRPQIEAKDLDTKIDDMTWRSLFERDDRLKAASAASGRKQLPQWTPMKPGPGGRPVADAALRVLHAFVAAHPER